MAILENCLCMVLSFKDFSSNIILNFTVLHLRFITLAHTQLESQDFKTCLQLMLDRGASFLQKLGNQNLT